MVILTIPSMDNETMAEGDDRRGELPFPLPFGKLYGQEESKNAMSLITEL